MKTESLREPSVFRKAQRKETLILSKDDCIGVSLAAFKKSKKPLQRITPYAIIVKALGWPGFFKCEFSTCTDSVICDILIKHVNWPSAEERWNEV